MTNHSLLQFKSSVNPEDPFINCYYCFLRVTGASLIQMNLISWVVSVLLLWCPFHRYKTQHLFSLRIQPVKTYSLILLHKYCHLSLKQLLLHHLTSMNCHHHLWIHLYPDQQLGDYCQLLFLLLQPKKVSKQPIEWKQTVVAQLQSCHPQLCHPHHK